MGWGQPELEQTSPQFQLVAGQIFPSPPSADRGNRELCGHRLGSMTEGRCTERDAVEKPHGPQATFPGKQIGYSVKKIHCKCRTLIEKNQTHERLPELFHHLPYRPILQSLPDLLVIVVDTATYLFRRHCSGLGGGRLLHGAGVDTIGCGVGSEKCNQQ